MCCSVYLHISQSPWQRGEAHAVALDNWSLQRDTRLLLRAQVIEAKASLKLNEHNHTLIHTFEVILMFKKKNKGQHTVILHQVCHNYPLQNKSYSQYNPDIHQNMLKTLQMALKHTGITTPYI